MPENLENSAVATGLEKVSFHSNLKERQCQRMFNLPHNCTHLTCYQSNAQHSLSQVSTVHELPDVQASFRNAEEPEIKLPIAVGSSKQQESSRKTSTSALLAVPKPLTMWITTTGKFFKRWESQTILPASWEISMQVKKQQLVPDMKQQTGSKLGKE